MSKNFTDLTTIQRGEVFEQLCLIYQELQTEQGPGACKICGRCCHFAIAGHRLYASAIELYWAAQSPGPFLVENLQKDTCPMLHGQSCTARNHRMLGCRTYFCDDTDLKRDQAEARHEKYLNKIKALHKKYHIAWEYQDCIGFFVAKSNDT